MKMVGRADVVLISRFRKVLALGAFILLVPSILLGLAYLLGRLEKFAVMVP
jgi:hypothetical protein